MTTEPLRRRSVFPIRSEQQPMITPAEVAEVASRNGFEPVQASVADTDLTPRRKRQPTGRDHQFNVRLRRETIDFIYQEANGRNVPIAQVIEEMVEALRAKSGRI